MTRTRKILLGLGAGFALLIVLLALVLPLVARGPVSTRVRAAVNESVEANVEWGSVGITFFRSFPDLGVRLDDLTVVGRGAFEGDTLAAIGSFRLLLSVPSVVRGVLGGGPVVVRSVELHQPVLHLRVLEDGTANWHIAKDAPDEPADTPAAQPEDGRALAVRLKGLEIRDATITYDDEKSGSSATIRGFTQSLSGDFSRDAFVLRTSAQADEASLTFAGVPYLNRARLGVTAEIDADMAQKRFTFRDNEVRLNDLPLRFSGSIALAEGQTALDLTFGAPETDFRHLLSLVPAIYAQDFERLQTSGTMAVSGTVKGTLGEDAFPAFTLQATVADGTFRYPDLPLPARDIALNLSVRNPGGHVDSTVVHLERFHVVIGDDPVDASLVLRTPISDPDVDLRAAGRLDLGALRQTVKLEGIEELAGVITADAAIRTRLSWVDSARYDRIAASGSVEARGVALRGANLRQPIAVDEAVLRFTPQHAELATFRGRAGSSDIALTGRLENLLGFALRDEDLRGRASFRSASFNLDEWRSGEGELQVIPVPAGIDFALDAAIDRLTFGKLEMTDARGAVRVKDRRLTLEEFVVKTLGGEVAVSGFYETVDTTRPAFDAKLRLANLDIPAAFQTLATVQALAPIARWAQGRFSADMGVRGALGANMMPVFEVLNGQGELEATGVALQDFPPLDRLSRMLEMPQLADPALDALRSTFEIRDGRMHLRPFDVRLGDIVARVSGSNGIDRSIDYSLRLDVPRAMLGTEANRAIAAALSKGQRVGLDLQAGDVIELGVRITGTVTDPSVSVDAGRVVTAARERVEQAVREEVETRLDDVRERAEERVDTARARLAAEADSIVREAEERAAAIRAEAQQLADRARAEAYARADSLVARATNPLARRGAELAADRLRKEGDDAAARILREADARAEQLVAEARRRAEQIRGGPAPAGGGGTPPDTAPPDAPASDTAAPDSAAPDTAPLDAAGPDGPAPDAAPPDAAAGPRA